MIYSTSVYGKINLFICFLIAVPSLVYGMDGNVIAKVNQQNDDEKINLYDVISFKSLKYRDKKIGNLLELKKEIQSQDGNNLNANAHRDAFIRGATNVAINIGTSTIIGKPTAFILDAVSPSGENIRTLRNKVDRCNQEHVPNPVADGLYAMQVGCTYQESLQAMSLGLQGLEKLSIIKRKIIDSISQGLITGVDKIGLTEKNINTLAAFVHESIKTAPEYIKKSYTQLLEKNNNHHHHHEQLEEQFTIAALSQKKKEKFNKQKALLDADVTLPGNEANQAVCQMLENHQLKFEELIANYTEHILERSADAQALRNDTKFEKDLATAQDAFTGVAAVASLLGRKSDAYAIATFGQASAQAITSISTLMTAGALGAGINPYVGILTSIASLCSLAEDEQQDNTQEILDAITNGIIFLSEQIFQLQKEMHEEFGQVKKMLNQQHLRVLEEFVVVHQDNATALEKLKNIHTYIQANNLAIQSGLDALHAKINDNFNMTIGNLNGLRIEEIDDLIQKSALLVQRNDVTDQEFNRCIEELYVKATSRASADALTGGAVDIHNASAIATSLEETPGNNVFSHPAFSNINLLSKYMEHTENGFRHTKLVNPLIWIKCVDTIVHSMHHKITNNEEYPATEKDKSLDIQKLMMLKEQGEKIITFIKTIAQNRYTQQIATKYEHALTELSNAIKAEQKVFEEQETQILTREQANSIEREKSQAKRIFDSYECKKCVEHINHAIDSANLLYQFDTWLGGCPAKRHAYIRDKVVAAPHYAIHYENGKWVTADEVRKPDEQFKKLQQAYVQTIAHTQQQLRQKTKVDLTKQEITPIGNTKNQWIIPADQNNRLPVIALPVQELPINPVYIAAENNCLGALSHEYTIEDKKLHLRSFFTIKDTQQKIEVLHISKECPFDSLYEAGENMIHIWYGGRYPQSIDVYKYTADLDYYWKSFSAYYPPETAYPAERDTFVSTAQREADQAAEHLPLIQQLLKKNQEEKRLQFNKEIINAVSSHASVSSVYKAAQKADLYFKLLDSFLTLMYSDLIQDNTQPLHQHFKAIKNNDEHSIKNSAALTKYVANYASNREHSQANYLPFYIERTTQKLSAELNQIFNALPPAQLNHVRRVIDSINALVVQYQARVIRPRIAIQPALPAAQMLEQMRQDMADKDKKIGALIATNQQLAQDNKQLAAETRIVKQELADVKQQLQTIMALLTQMNNNRPQQ